MAQFRDIHALQKRAHDLDAWLRKTAPESLTEQKHLDEGTQERVYWHYGYMVALRDVLKFLTDSPEPSQKSHRQGTTSSRSVV